ncbi:MAG: CatB-related O-acetyltransferase [Bacteroides sp.]|nr:CatB-related O-acetyltransferase [Bacteroides sp.]
MMGRGSYISSNSNITARIGRFSSIGPRVNTIQGRHPFHKPFVSSSPFFFSSMTLFGKSFVDKSYFKEYKYAYPPYFTVSIGSDCWIGADVKIISGVNIHDGAVILAGAIVTKDIPPYAIVGGVPGKILGYRYDEDICNKLTAIKWWDKSIDWLNKNNHLLRDIDLFIKICS